MKHPLNVLLRIGRSDEERIALRGDLEEECRSRNTEGHGRVRT